MKEMCGWGRGKNFPPPVVVWFAESKDTCCVPPKGLFLYLCIQHGRFSERFFPKREEKSVFFAECSVMCLTLQSGYGMNDKVSDKNQTKIEVRC